MTQSPTLGPKGEGEQSSFGWDTNTWITNMATPYGTTTFTDSATPDMTTVEILGGRVYGETIDGVEGYFQAT